MRKEYKLTEVDKLPVGFILHTEIKSKRSSIPIFKGKIKIVKNDDRFLVIKNIKDKIFYKMDWYLHNENLMLISNQTRSNLYTNFYNLNSISKYEYINT